MKEFLNALFNSQTFFVRAVRGGLGAAVTVGVDAPLWAVAAAVLMGFLGAGEPNQQ